MSDHEFFVCDCHSPEHTLRFNLNDDPDDPQIYTSVFLSQYRSWYARVWIAIKYVFGYKCRYGHFDCFLMKPEDVPRFKRLLDRLEDLKK